MRRNILFEKDGSFDPDKIRSRVSPQLYAFLLPSICLLLSAESRADK